ncbi:tripartite tricarboxylate transporter TctB family protein [Bacillaceae bacterium]
MKRVNAGVLAGILTLVFAVIILLESFSYDYQGPLGPGPGLFPRWLSGLLIVLSGFYIFDSVKKDVIKIIDILPKGKELRALLSILGALIVFILIVPYTGFIVAGTVFLFILLVREYKWYVGLGISAGVSAFLFWVFDTLLNVPLPVNAFGW